MNPVAEWQPNPASMAVAALTSPSPPPSLTAWPRIRIDPPAPHCYAAAPKTARIGGMACCARGAGRWAVSRFSGRTGWVARGGLAAAVGIGLGGCGRLGEQVEAPD